MPRLPLTSICIPTFNGTSFLNEALDSVESQDYRSLEIIVSDDHSTDATWDVLSDYKRNSSFPVTLLKHTKDSLAGNWNNCIQHSSGKYIKFLFQDDFLAPSCVSEMVFLAESDKDIGLVFSPRLLQIEHDSSTNENCQKIAACCSNLHEHWSILKTVQDGRNLLGDPKLVTHGPWNKIGEPSIVLLKTATLGKTGLFDPSLKQLVDLDMWWRTMAESKVAFIDQPISTFRVHSSQESVKNLHSGEATKDARRFVSKVLQSNYCNYLSPETKKYLAEYLSPPKPENLIKRVAKRLVKKLLRRRR
jgi:glycosyltransferase involved in cell wall biosynthesis